MALGFTTAARTQEALAILALIDVSTAGSVTIYDGSVQGTGGRPATGGSDANSVVLAVVPLEATSFSESAGVLTALGVPISDIDGANANGTAEWFRIADGNGLAIIDGNVGTSGSDLNLNTLTFTAGLAVDITSMVLTIGNP